LQLFSSTPATTHITPSSLPRKAGTLTSSHIAWQETEAKTGINPKHRYTLAEK